MTRATVLAAELPRGRRLRQALRHRVFGLGLLIVLAIGLGALLAPWLSPGDPLAMEMTNRLQPPSRAHLLGTDEFGRDLLSRLLHGGRVTLGVAVLSVAVAAVIGILVALLSGFYGGAVDLSLMRVVDIFLSFPVLLLAIALVAALGPGPKNVVIALGLVFWTQYARVVRSSTLSAREEDYVDAARAIGCSSGRILFRHILPNVVSPAIVLASLGLGQAVVAESALSFLGLGVQPPEPSWGRTLAFGMRFLRTAPHMTTVPGLAIAVAVLGFNLMGDGLRDILDPRGGERFRSV